MKRKVGIVSTTSVLFIGSNIFPDGFLYLFSHNWIYRPTRRHKGVGKVRTEFSAAVNNSEGLLARKRWRMDSVGSGSVYHEWRSIPVLNTGGQNIFNNTLVFI